MLYNSQKHIFKTGHTLSLTTQGLVCNDAIDNFFLIIQRLNL
jgi:hypothetical protein